MRVVAAFQNVSAELLADPAHVVDCDVLICGDDVKAREAVVRLAADIDPAYAAWIGQALAAGIEIIGITCEVAPSGISLANPITLTL